METEVLYGLLGMLALLLSAAGWSLFTTYKRNKSN